MAKAIRLFAVRLASARPLYWALEKVVLLVVTKFAMSAVPSRPPPTPGFEVLVQVRSWVPSPVFNGEPMSKPWPGIVLQFTFSVSPASAHVEGLIFVLLTPAPGKLR